ncbi:hypothetical protein BJV78DRAFT_1156610 [Lactifluus subvellereus]|nr:hypothetical protein BJV78DRAFT_1156610 [Lactifluus subvellereus]
MPDRWPTEHRQRDNVQNYVPPTVHDLAPVFWEDAENQPAPRPDIDATIQGCSCLRCSSTRHAHAGPPAQFAIEDRDLRIAGGPTIPYANQGRGMDNPVNISPNVPGPAQTQFVAPHGPYLVEVLLQENQENIGYAPLRGEVGRAPASRNVWPDQTPVPDMSVTEGLRHLAGRYLDNPESQPTRFGPTGQKPRGSLAHFSSTGTPRIAGTVVQSCRKKFEIYDELSEVEIKTRRIMGITPDSRQQQADGTKRHFPSNPSPRCV